ncbi:hypothetical protein DSO57_1034978 [Entomophthora muscae]|uniref:Uncharacterized protein n=1 Tax=Entomophthora muscae TaxID=34485 RepID=A0ACC2UK73_9FUNG|nr:hypothetical protein DSO57_1034978 [Entomophthora muscae]
MKLPPAHKNFSLSHLPDSSIVPRAKAVVFEALLVVNHQLYVDLGDDSHHMETASYYLTISVTPGPGLKMDALPPQVTTNPMVGSVHPAYGPSYPGF